ncbi:MAG: hypothetical protein JJU45_05025 [Acidimicrobiia bacterium]|nr:hypothetical protein [Acidimicrobiia bacterium]
MSYKEADLVAEATELLGDGDNGGEPVIAAGVFGLAGLALAATAGTALGGVVAEEVSTAAPASAAGGAANVAGAVLGGIVAKQAYAESQGASVQLLVAVTESTIHILNRDHDHLPVQLASFDRATCEVTIKKFGLSRHVDLRDPETNAALHLTGAGGGFSPLAKGDKLVMALLSD